MVFNSVQKFHLKFKVNLKLIQMLQKLYRHPSITTTVNYQSNFIHKDVDDALENVIGF